MANANVGFWMCLVADSVVWRGDITMEGASNQAVGAEPLVSLYMSREDFCTPVCFFRLVDLRYVCSQAPWWLIGPLSPIFFYCYSGAVICGCRLRYKHGYFFFSHDDGCGAVNSFPGTQDGISLATLAPFSCFSTPQTDCCVSYHLQNATPDQFMLYHGKRSSIGKGALLRATHCRFRDVDNDSDSRQTGVAV